MKTSFLVPIGVTIGLLSATAAMTSTVTTEYGRPLLVTVEASVAACSDIALGTGTDVQSWHDALAGKRVRDLVVQASWTKASAEDPGAEPAVLLAATATDCALTN